MIINSQKHELLKEYAENILSWRKKVNLISSNSTLEDIWVRHIADSIQIYNLISNLHHKIIYDLGTGAGFPGMVMAILDEGNMYYLIESNHKKCTFLSFIIAQLKLNNVVVYNKRIEDIKGQRADIIVSRAMTSLVSLCEYAFPLLNRGGLNKGGFCLFPKGERYKEELQLFNKSKWRNKFTYSLINSSTNALSKIIRLDCKS